MRHCYGLIVFCVDIQKVMVKAGVNVRLGLAHLLLPGNEMWRDGGTCMRCAEFSRWFSNVAGHTKANLLHVDRRSSALVTCQGICSASSTCPARDRR